MQLGLLGGLFGHLVPLPVARDGPGYGVIGHLVIGCFVFGRRFGRTFRLLLRGGLLSTVDVTNATLTVSIIVIVVVLLCTGAAGCRPRAGHSHALCIG